MTDVHRFSEDVTDILLSMLHRLDEDGIVELDHRNTWVTTKKWRAKLKMHELREEQD